MATKAQLWSVAEAARSVSAKLRSGGVGITGAELADELDVALKALDPESFVAPEQPAQEPAPAEEPAQA